METRLSRLDAMASDGGRGAEATERLIAAVERAQAALAAGRRETARHLAAGGAEERVRAVLDRLRVLHRDVLMPIVQSRQRILRDVGTVWMEEDIRRVHEMPRLVVHFDSIDARPEAPQAYMTIHASADGSAVVSQSYVQPVKTTAVLTTRLEHLSPAVLKELLDQFLATALEAGEAMGEG